VDLGDDVLEVGPGPGLTTDLLSDRGPSTADRRGGGCRPWRRRSQGATEGHQTWRSSTPTPATPDSKRTASRRRPASPMLPSRPRPSRSRDRLFARGAPRPSSGGSFNRPPTRSTLKWLREAHADDVFVPKSTPTPWALGSKAVRFCTSVDMEGSGLQGSLQAHGSPESVSYPPNASVVCLPGAPSAAQLPTPLRSPTRAARERRRATAAEGRTKAETPPPT